MTRRAEGPAGDILPLALTMGDPAGIGGEVTLKAWLRRDEDVPCFFVIDDPGRLDRLSKRLDLPVRLRVIDRVEETARVFATALPVMAQPLAVDPVPGAPDGANAGAVVESIRRAVDHVLAGEVAGIVTNPIHKRVLYERGFDFPGHTEFLGALAGVDGKPVMMLACRHLRTVPVTTHMSLAGALRALRSDGIVAVGSAVDESLRRDFGLDPPRLAVAGLNPHAGEDGTLGDEERRIIEPAVDTLRALGIDVRGPVAADALFSAGQRPTYDAAICMYHDQALIPIKTLDFEGAVNVTLALPFVRTSPDHGTALDIAGTGRASERSLIAALVLARDMVRHRAAYRSP